MSPTYNPIASVIIPFLNGGSWLAEAIESVIKQSYPYWEIVLIDDGSEKEAGEIAKDYCNKYPDKIFYTDHPGHTNLGVTVSRNTGIRLSKGSFLAFLDSDDCWLADKLLHQFELFKIYPEAQMICEASKFWYSWNNPKAKDVIVKIGLPQDKLYDPPQLLKHLYPLGKGAPPCPTGIIIKKEAFDRSGGFEELFTGVNQLYEDQAFLSKIYLHERVYISGRANNLYRKRPGSLTDLGNDGTHYKTVRLFFLNWLEKYIKHQNIEDDSVINLINAARIALFN